MANEEQVEILKSGVENWNRWRDEQDPYEACDLAEADLTGLDLKNARLPEALLNEANLSDSNLSRANLSGAQLRGAKLERANFGGADLRGAYIRGAKLNDSNLAGANICGANLNGSQMQYAFLGDCDLQGVDLSGASLYRAVLAGAILTRAELAGADFEEANLAGADLRNTSLVGANLARAILNRARLCGASLEEAIFSGTSLVDLSLKNSTGLHTCSHRGASAIDFSTLSRSQAAIPLVFLQGCGLPEDYITYIRSLTANLIEFYSCFISYSHEDKSFAQRLHDQLQARGIRCWLDEHQLLPGDDIYEQVDRGIKLWDKVLLCCSEASLTSWWCDNEIDTTFDKEAMHLAGIRHASVWIGS